MHNQTALNADSIGAVAKANDIDTRRQIVNIYVGAARALRDIAFLNERAAHI